MKKVLGVFALLLGMSLSASVLAWGMECDRIECDMKTGICTGTDCKLVPDATRQP
jgi:hypothetical protein